MSSTDWVAVDLMTSQERLQAINHFSEELAKSLEGGKRIRRSMNTVATLSKLSKSELYQKAKAKGINGRSKLNKEQLIKVLCK